jgi:ribosomal protein L44E
MSILYTCQVCKKAKGIKKAIRAGRIEIGEKVAK